mmetsp:Transcript_19677/g.60640  ORF Transcript_19677/g.60640 Transcript_19677/m.60640 type:complete len:296 (+) Transcript_19677:199-1086(+)
MSSPSASTAARLTSKLGAAAEDVGDRPRSRSSSAPPASAASRTWKTTACPSKRSPFSVADALTRRATWRSAGDHAAIGSSSGTSRPWSTSSALASNGVRRSASPCSRQNAPATPKSDENSERPSSSGAASATSASRRVSSTSYARYSDTRWLRRAPGASARKRESLSRRSSLRDRPCSVHESAMPSPSRLRDTSAEVSSESRRRATRVDVAPTRGDVAATRGDARRAARRSSIVTARPPPGATRTSRRRRRRVRAVVGASSRDGLSAACCGGVCRDRLCPALLTRRGRDVLPKGD